MAGTIKSSGIKNALKLIIYFKKKQNKELHQLEMWNPQTSADWIEVLNPVSNPLW